MKILKTSDCIVNEIIQCEGIQIFNYVSGKQVKELCEAVANVICDGNTYIIKMSKEERENLPYLSGMKVSREIHIDPLVTCGECKWWNKGFCNNGRADANLKLDKNCFCDEGERRADEHNT